MILKWCISNFNYFFFWFLSWITEMSFNCIYHIYHCMYFTLQFIHNNFFYIKYHSINFNENVTYFPICSQLHVRLPLFSGCGWLENSGIYKAAQADEKTSTIWCISLLNWVKSTFTCLPLTHCFVFVVRSI